MRNTPQRLRSIAPPTRDKIILWSAVIAGCGILALLGRSAAIHRFNTDVFTGNILFAVFFVLFIGLYLALQSTLETLFAGIFKKRTTAVATTNSGQQVIFGRNEYEAPTDVEYFEPISNAVCEVESADEIMAEEKYQEESEQRLLEEAYQDFLDGQTPQERFDMENRIIRVKKEPEYNADAGCFTSIIENAVFHNDDGTILIEEWDSDVFLTADGCVYSIENIDEIIKFYEKHKDKSDVLNHHDVCNAAYNDFMTEQRELYVMQIAFICAYLTKSLASHIEADQLSVLHQNAERLTTDMAAPLEPVKLRNGHRLSTDDLKHIGYNIGKFLKLNGKMIARFVKVAFPVDFAKIGLGTIEAKLCARNPDVDTIPIYMNNEMDKLFAHFKETGEINFKILEA